MGVRIWREKVEGERLFLPPAVRRILPEEVKVLSSNPLVVLSPAWMDLREVERHLLHMLLELRKRLNGASTYITH